MSVSAGAVAVAGVLDASLREPTLAVHPVRWAGRYLDTAARLVPAAPRRTALPMGGLAWAVGAAAAFGAGALVERQVRGAAAWRRSLAIGVALWPLLSGRLLLDEVEGVERGLAVDIEAGRAAVGRIVSRDVTSLSESQVRQAGLESLAENLSDSVTAPLCWYVVGGLPMVALYRYANTADAMWGHRSPRWRHAGWVAARADDLLNLVPARLTALALSLPRVPLGVVRDEARRTPSPNAGWPMAALALRLGVRLEKLDTYQLHARGRSPTALDTALAVRMVRRRIGGLVAGAVVLAWLRRRVAS